jgi:pectate lyase
VFTIEREVAPPAGWHAFHRAGNTVGNHQPVVVTGGSAAAANRVYTCGTKRCIFDALKEAGNEPKIIRVYGNIDLRVDDDGVFREWTSWDDQKGSAIVLPSNTTLVGINDAAGNPARLISAQVEIGRELADYETWVTTKPQEDYPGWTRNVIVRNLWIQTSWDVQPEDTANAYYDGMVVAMAQNVWIDHVTVTDGQYSSLVVAANGGGTRHDGALDIVRGADYVSVTNSLFRDHDKTTLVSNGDAGRRWSDENRFHVTFSGNYYKDTGSRTPRVRWGQVHIYDTFVEGDRSSTTATRYGSGVGLGYNSDVLMESTLWFVEPTKQAEACGKILVDHGSNVAMRQRRTWLKSTKYLPGGLDVTADLNGCGFASAVNWTPPYAYTVESAPLNLECIVKGGAGAGKIGRFNTSTAASCISAPVSGG